MFYLGSIRKLFKNYPGLTAGFIFSAVMFILVASFETLWFEPIEKRVLKSNASSVFHALVDSKENHLRLQRKISDLPGVRFVEIMDKQTINTRVNEILKTLNETGLKREWISASYHGLKVHLKENLSNRSVNLIQDYVKRLSSNGGVTLGPVSRTNTDQYKGSKEKTMLTMKYGLIFLVGLIWFCFFLPLKKKIEAQSYLMEQFTRKKSVSFKTYLTLLCVPLIISMVFMGVGLEWFHLRGVIAICLLILFSFLLVGRSSWKPQS